MSEIKFTKEELESLRSELPNSKWMAQYQQDPTSEERDLVKVLNEKYGPGALDPKTGVFTPKPIEETQEIAAAK